MTCKVTRDKNNQLSITEEGVERQFNSTDISNNKILIESILSKLSDDQLNTQLSEQYDELTEDENSFITFLNETSQIKDKNLRFILFDYRDNLKDADYYNEILSVKDDNNNESELYWDLVDYVSNNWENKLLDGYKNIVESRNKPRNNRKEIALVLLAKSYELFGKQVSIDQLLSKLKLPYTKYLPLIRFNKDKNIISVNDALDIIINNSNNNDIVSLAKHIKTLNINTDINFTVLQAFEAGHYNPLNNKIIINSIFDWSTYPIEETILHELLHKLTYSTIHSDKGKKWNTFYSEIITHIEKLGINKDDWYPLTNADELLTGIFTNTEFRDFLRTIPDTTESYKNLFKQIIEWFKSLFTKIKDKNLFDEILYEANDLMDIIEEADFNSSSVGDYVEPLLLRVQSPSKLTQAEIKTLLDADRAFITEKEGNKYKTKDGQVIKKRVTDFVDAIRKKLFRNSSGVPQEELEFIAKKGTVVHLYKQLIMDYLIAGKDIKQQEVEDEVYSALKTQDEFKNEDKSFMQMTKKQFDDFVKPIEYLYQDIKTEDPNAIILTEQVVHDKLKDTAGTIDVLVLYSDGSVSIYDYKTKNFKKQGNKYKRISYIDEMFYDSQIGRYKDILKRQYKITTFRKSRVLPIHVNYKNNKGELVNSGFQILNSGYNKSSSVFNYLDPIPVAYELTNTDADRTLEKLLNAREDARLKLKSLTGKVRALKLLEHNKLDQAIKQIQLKDQINKTVINLYDTIQKANKTIQESSDPTKSYDYHLSKLLKAKDELDLYEYFIIDFEDDIKASADRIAKDKGEDAKTAYLNKINNINTSLINTRDAITQRQFEIAQSQVENDDLLRPTKEKGTLGRLFDDITKWSNPIFKRFSELVRTLYNKVRSDVNQVIDEVTEKDKVYKEWAKTKGLSGTKIFDPILRSTGKLITPLNKQFRDDTKKYQSLVSESNDKKALKWLKDHYVFDKEKYFKALDELKEKLNILNVSEEQRNEELSNLHRYNPNNSKFGNYAWMNTVKNPYLQPKSWDQMEIEYVEPQWLELQKPNNKPALDYLNMYYKYNKLFKDLTGDRAFTQNFIPYINASFLEQFSNLGFSAIVNRLGKDSLLTPLTIRDQDTTFGSVDSDGEKISTIPLLYTTPQSIPLTAKEKEKLKNQIKIPNTDPRYDDELERLIKNAEFKKGVELSSKDLSISLVLMAKSVYEHTYRHAIETEALTLREILNEYREYATDKFGDYAENPLTNSLRLKSKVSEKTLSAFDSFLKYHVYGQKIQSDDIDIMGLSGTKLLQALTKMQAIKFMGLSVKLGISSFVGARVNTWITGKEALYYNNEHVNEAKKQLSKGNDKDLALLGLFEPSNRNLTYEKALKLSASGLKSLVNMHNLFVFHNKGSDRITSLVLLSMLRNYTLDSDGKIKNLNSPTTKILSDNPVSLYDQLTLTEDGVINISEIPQEEYYKFRSIVGHVVNSVMGEMSDEQANIANMNILTSMLMAFRNWIPGMTRTRFSSLNQNPTTEEYEYGRYIAGLHHILSKGVLPAVKDTMKLLVMYNADGTINETKLDTIYKRFKLQNPDSELTIDEFREISKSRLKSLASELRAFLFFWAAVTAMMIAGFDEDDEDRPKALNIALRNLYEASRRSYLELSFFVPVANFSAVKQIIDSPAAVTRELDSFVQVSRNTLDNFQDMIIEDPRDKTGWGYYTLKNYIPVGNQIADMLGVFNQQHSKSFGEKLIPNIFGEKDLTSGLFK